MEVEGIGRVERWVELTEVALPLVSFRWTFVFHHDGAVLTSDSTLMFRERSEIEAHLETVGYELEEVRDAPDRPGREFVYFAPPPSRVTSPSPGPVLGNDPLKAYIGRALVD